MGQLLDILRCRAKQLPSPPSAAAEQPTWNVCLGQEHIAFGLWQGAPLTSDLIALDTETRLIQARQIPDLALVSVSDGQQHCIVAPPDLAGFLLMHQHRHFVCHNACFDYWVVERFLRESRCQEALDVWQSIVDQSRLHDTMLLDALIRLAKTDEDPRRMRDLAAVAKEYAGLVIDKSDPYRLRYGEIIGLDWETVEPGFFQYAMKDAIVTILAFQQMTQAARRLLEKHRTELQPGAIREFGILTEALQVQGAVALAAIERNGLHLDLQQVEQVRKRIVKQILQHTQILENMELAKGLFKRDKTGEIIRAPKSGSPRVDHERLTSALQAIVETAEIPIDVPRTKKTDRITTSAKYWSQHEDLHPFISKWTGLVNLAKLNQFLANLSNIHIYPRYSPLVRTGRTSCSNPNIQQLPRSAGFREMVVPSPGHYLLAIDYAAIELRTLAAICEHRYGESVLARIIRDGVDPHAYTAALFEGLDLDAFLALRETNAEGYRQRRQQAKALNFGIPGGLGPASLVDYAASSYGVTLTLETAREFRDKLIREIYPEMERYLREDTEAILAANLQTDVGALQHALPLTTTARNVIQGQTCKADGTAYNQAWCERIWDTLLALNRNRELQSKLEKRQGSEELYSRLFWGPVVTLTGRLRGRVSFSQARNTPFQGLAADGAKRALWKLTLAGYRLVAFIHDEVLIELPVDADHAAEANRIDQIMCEAMREFTGAVPVACEYALAERWHKQAEAVYDGEGRLVPWKPADHIVGPRS